MEGYRFTQLTIDYDDEQVYIPHSGWGKLRLKYSAQPEVWYLNLKVNGNHVIANEPVLGSGPAIGFWFPLGVEDGVEVNETMHSIGLTLDPMPTELFVETEETAVEVAQESLRVTSGFIGRSIPPPGPPVPIVGGIVEPEPCVNTGIENPEQGTDECVPYAYLNSLKWMNDKHDLGIPENMLDIDYIKDMLDWIPPTPGADGGTRVGKYSVHGSKPKFDWQHKQRNFTKWVKTEKVEISNADKVAKLLKADCDVEVMFPHHGAVVVGWAPVSKLKIKIDILHDTMQDNPNGQEIERIEWNPVENKITGGTSVEGSSIEFFVCECPKTDEYAGIKGDPHVMTWSGSWFDFHGVCDLVMAHVSNFEPGLDLDIHVRTSSRQEYSYISSAAVCIGSDILEVSSYGEWALNDVLGAELHGSAANLAGFEILHSQVNKKKHEFTIMLGHNEAITITTFKDIVSVSIHDSGDILHGRFDDSTGLMGSRLSGAMLTRKRTLLDDANAFGQEWQIRSDEPKLFRSERAPQYPAHCILPTSTSFETGRRLGHVPIDRVAAEQACSHHKEGPEKVACIFDVLATGDPDIAMM